MTEELLSHLSMIAVALLASGAAAFFSFAAYGALAGALPAEGVDRPVLASVPARAMQRLRALNRRMLGRSYEQKLRQTLLRAGDPRGYPPEDILGLQELGFAAGLLLGLGVGRGLAGTLAASGVLAAAGAASPWVWLRDQVRRRQLLIARALPFNLDLLTLAVEAGLDFTGALAKVVDKGKGGPLRDELGWALKQLKMGKTREEALKALIARVDLPPLTTFLTALIHADRMGTGLGKVLRIQSTQLRTERTQRAEKLASQAPVKMLFPLVACIFPAVFLILFGPIVFALFFGPGAG
jgi:tight adherence protein C